MVFTVGYKEQYDKYLHFPKNPMDKGCSGGPWIEKEPSGYYVVGLNSHMLLGAVIKGLFSPQFNIHTRTLFNDAKAHAELNTKKNDRGFEVEEDRTFDHIEENGNFDNIEEGTGLGYAEEDRNSVDVEEDTEDIFEDYSSAECTLICPIWCDKTNHALCVKFETRTGCSCLSW